MKKTSTCQVGADKSKSKAIKFRNTPWLLKQNLIGHSKINEQIKKYLYNWIMNYPKVLRSPIFKYCLKVNIDGHTKPPNFPQLLLQVSVQELHNSLVSDPVDSGLKEARYAEINIIISDSTLR